MTAKHRIFAAVSVGLVGMLLLPVAAIAGEQPAADAGKSAANPPAAVPAHRVLACYFHRTIRCDTCKKIGAYIEESIKTGMPQQMKDRTVSVQMIDYQDVKNQKYTNYYKITGPTLVILDVQDGKVKQWKTAPRVWSLVGNKDAFVKYVQGEVRGYLEPKK